MRSPKDGGLLGIEWGVIPQVSNIVFPDQNSGVRCQCSKGFDTIIYDALLIYLFIYLFICDVYTGNPIQQRWFKRRPVYILALYTRFTVYGLLDAGLNGGLFTY